MAAKKALREEYQRKNTKEREQKIRLINISHSQLSRQESELAKISEKCRNAPCPDTPWHPTIWLFISVLFSQPSVRVYHFLTLF